MKKIFTIIAAMLLSVTALYANKTLNYALSDLSGEGVTWSNGTLTTTGDWQGVAHNYGDDPLNVDGYSMATITLESTPAEGVTVFFNITYADNSSSDASVTNGSTTGRLTLQSTSIKQIDVKLNKAATVTISSLVFEGAYGRTKTVDLLTGDHSMPGNYEWGEKVDFPKTEFEDAHEGDVVKISYEQIAEGDFGLHIKTNYNNYSVITPNAYGLSVGSTSRLFVLTNADLQTIAGQNNLYIQGKNVKITHIELTKHYDVLWSGSETVGEWTGGVSIAWNRLKDDLKAGDTICVRVDTIKAVAGKTNQIYCTYKSDMSGKFNSDFSYIFQDGDADKLPMIAKLPVQTAMLSQLNGEQLNFGGVYYHMTDIYIVKDAGDPTAIDEVSQSQRQCQKLIKNGQLFIIRDDKTYTIQGQRVY